MILFVFHVVMMPLINDNDRGHEPLQVFAASMQCLYCADYDIHARISPTLGHLDHKRDAGNLS